MGKCPIQDIGGSLNLIMNAMGSVKDSGFVFFYYSGFYGIDLPY